MRSIFKVLIFSSLFVAISFVGYAQEQNPELAQEYMIQAELTLEATQALDDVRPILITAADLDTTFIKANFEAGKILVETVGKDLAVKYFMRVLRQDPDYNFSIEYWIGKSYQYGLNFDKALEYYTLYKERLNKKSNYQGKDKISLASVDRGIFECENGKEFVSRPGNYSIVSIGREINSEYEDYAPVFNENEDEVVFTSRRREDNLNENVFEDNKPFEDIFTSRKSGGVWSRAKNIGAPVNTPYHDSNLALSADGGTLFIYKDNNGGDIYSTERNADGTWAEPIPLPGIINSSFEEKSITISSDERTLYFASNRPGGFGGLDIYRATKDSKGEWSNVRNLGPTINTEFDDDGPYIDYDNVTLYFSSQGRKGMGGYDIFKTTLDPATNEWSEPENLGYPINTPDDDIYFVASKDGKRAYYSSVREDGMGYTDIYLITIPEGLKKTEPIAAVEPDPTPDPDTSKVTPVVVPKKEIVPIKYTVTVVDAQSKNPLDAKIGLQGMRDNVVVGSSNKGTGVKEFTIVSPEAKEYRLSVEIEGYIFVNQSLKIEGATTEAKSLSKTIEMQKLVVGVSSILRNIYFDFDKATFQEESYNELNKLERMLKQNEALSVEISGHTDNIGGKAYNLQLSTRRAEAVKDFLTSKGIDSRRITAVGHGETKPLASNDDEEDGREINRRVEMKVLGNK